VAIKELVLMTIMLWVVVSMDGQCFSPTLFRQFESPLSMKKNLPISHSKLLHVDMDKKKNIHETFTNPIVNGK
jgi:hypothetical protein